jgi:hypothetical protein
MVQAEVIVKKFTAVSLRSGQGGIAAPKGLFGFPRPACHLNPKLGGKGDDRGGRGRVTPLFPEKGHREVKDNALPDLLRPCYPTQHLREFR